MPTCWRGNWNLLGDKRCLVAEQVLVAVAPGAHLVDAREYPYKYLREGVRLEPLGPAFKRA